VRYNDLGQELFISYFAHVVRYGIERLVLYPGESCCIYEFYQSLEAEHKAVEVLSITVTWRLTRLESVVSWPMYRSILDFETLLHPNEDRVRYRPVLFSAFLRDLQAADTL
jgi:hypothetical protein